MLTEQIIKKLLPKLKNKARQYDKVDYEDLAHDTIAKAWAIRDNFPPDVFPYLLLIMQNIHKDHIRKKHTVVNFNSYLFNNSHNLIRPNQHHTVALKECSKLDDFDVAFANAQGYTIKEIKKIKNRSGSFIHGKIKEFQENKDNYI